MESFGIHEYGIELNVERAKPRVRLCCPSLDFMRIFKLFGIGGRRWRLLHIPDLNQIFGNLHCIQCGTFLDLVAYKPKRHAVFVG